MTQLSTRATRDDESAVVGRAAPEGPAGQASTRLPQHKHCFTCGRAILVAKEFCDDDCRDQHIAVLKKKRRQLVVLWIVSMVIIGVVLIAQLGR